jgi:hypothetical protein
MDSPYPNDMVGLYTRFASSPGKVAQMPSNLYDKEISVVGRQIVYKYRD